VTFVYELYIYFVCACLSLNFTKRILTFFAIKTFVFRFVPQISYGVVLIVVFDNSFVFIIQVASSPMLRDCKHKFSAPEEEVMRARFCLMIKI
jgi:hypothetical protein